MATATTTTDHAAALAVAEKRRAAANAALAENEQTIRRCKPILDGNFGGTEGTVSEEERLRAEVALAEAKAVRPSLKLAAIVADGEYQATREARDRHAKTEHEARMRGLLRQAADSVRAAMEAMGRVRDEQFRFSAEVGQTLSDLAFLSELLPPTPVRGIGMTESVASYWVARIEERLKN